MMDDNLSTQEQKNTLPPLSEKDFVQENVAKNPLPFWLWLILLTIFIALVWGASGWLSAFMSRDTSSKPFLQVTNRQISLFLWQNPEFMRIHSKIKQGYLPGFQYEGKVGMELGLADEVVSAPPEVLFLYHTWNRLLSHEFIETPIPLEEFKEFIELYPEWQPRGWSKAPPAYVTFMQNLPQEKTQDLSKLPLDVIPKEVRLSFQGWKNYFKDGESVNKLPVKLDEMRTFLEKHPNYARPLWRNLVMEKYPNYLKSFSKGQKPTTGNVSEDELTAFLRQAYFNYMRSKSAS